MPNGERGQDHWMDQPYETMNLANRAFYHIRKAEEYQQDAERLEDWADENGGTPEMAALLLKDPNRNREAYQYKVATGNRNGHQQRAIMYSLAALLERSFAK